MTGSTLLHLESEIDAAIEEAFHKWCIPHTQDVLKLPGFLDARRLVRSPSWKGQGASMPILTLYELDDICALTSEEYEQHDASLPEIFTGRLRFRRSIFREIERSTTGEIPLGSTIFHVLTEVEKGFEDAFDRWYAGEHVPAVLETPGVHAARRFVQVEDPGGLGVDPECYTCLVIYEIEDAETLKHPDAIRAAESAKCPPELDRHRRVAHQVYEVYRG